MTTALAIILDAAARSPDAVAIEESDGTAVTYAALIDRARAFAAEPSDAPVVEIEAVRSADFVARCLGAWLAGRAFAPLAPDEPPARHAAIRARMAAAGAGLAYVIATSGSGGAPKAVMVGHRGLPGLLRAQIAAFALGPGDRALWLHAPSFDASISDWGTALASGATLVVPAARAEIATELARRAITHVDLPPVLLRQLVTPLTLRVVVLGGEACPVEAVRALARRVRVVVVYGPTEATVCASLVVVDAARWARPLIGEPLPGVTFRVIDDELYIGGDGLALGYAGDPDETARRFIERDGQRLYRTGDRVAVTSDGLAFVGRADRQIKLRGRRVELDEIELALRAIAGVRDAAVVLRAARLIAFVDSDLAAAVVMAALRERVPAWMLPARIVIAQLPRTPTGKLERGALEVPPRRPSRFTEPLAAELAALWCDALGTDAVGERDRFRDAGGDSLAAVTLLASTTASAIGLDPALLAGNPTFAELLAAARHGGAAATLSVAECERRGLAALERVLAAGSLDEGKRCGRAVLVTGATGLLGAHLIRALQGPLIALVRDPDTAPSGVEILRGDLAQPWLGMDPDAWRTLAGRVGTIVHAGATMQLPLDWAAHAATNVDGTAWLARLARESGAALHHVSTLAVFVGTDRRGARCGRDDVPEPTATAFGGYAQTKIAAEAIARASGAHVYRLGLLVEDAPRAGTQLGMVARGLAKLGAAPLLDTALRFDAMPVAAGARAIATATDRVTHVAGRATSLAELVGALRAHAPIADLPAAAWADRARAELADPDVAMAYLSLARRARPFDLFLATGMDFDSAPVEACALRLL